ncbi:Hint domain-containing protein [Methylobacterium sp. Leaf465]|uniref:Hint domain-containing protein n=1 Tax=Methylobacterium sp. Leaf465 TaxID=1736385 RepID=UPI000AE596BE|nr:Hint domain-containing protein [Methylobacterium sp. Leaf465]
MAILTDLNAGQRDEVTFLSGLDENGRIGGDTYYTWNYKDFSTTDVWMNKWYNDSKGAPLATTSQAGTPGGTVTYSFSAGLPVAAQPAYTAALSLWSDIADIKFEYVPDAKSANLLFTTFGEGGAATFIPNNGKTPIGSGDIPSQTSPLARGGQASIALEAPDNIWGSFELGRSKIMSDTAHEIGHVLGLGHGGYYNGGTFEGQRGPYDQNLWTLMSYIGTGDPNATFASQAPVNADWQGGWAQTPMAIDVLASQRYYGESKTSTFAGGQTYGFNTNITGASRDYFDFTKNSTPFVNLYNRGTNNTLDVSVFSTDTRINLNPGTFSTASANSAVTNNISISFGTRIDKAVTGAGDDVIYGNNNSNVIDGGGGNNAFVITGSSANFTIDRTSATSAIVTDKTTGAVDTLTNIDNIFFVDPVCFTTGTRLAVVRDGVVGEVSIEDLRLTDVAVTATGGRRSIRWIGRRDVLPDTYPVPATQWPVRILAGAFGTDACGQAVPARDLRLSPGHPVLIGADAANAGGVLVPIMNLIDGIAICREAVDRVTYWHVELDRHDILLAEGLPAESYFESGARAWFGSDTRQGWWRDVDGTASPLFGRCRPVAFDGPIVEAARCRIGSALRLRLAAQAAWPCSETRTMAA